MIIAFNKDRHMTRYTWHAQQWQSVETRLEQGRLPHALLLTGPQGVGKLEFALQLAAGLLCSQAPAAQACGQCQNCSLIAAGTHPDKKQLTFAVDAKSGKVAKELKIDQIRACLLYTSPSPRDQRGSRMPSSA